MLALLIFLYVIIYSFFLVNYFYYFIFFIFWINSFFIGLLGSNMHSIFVIDFVKDFFTGSILLSILVFIFPSLNVLDCFFISCWRDLNFWSKWTFFISFKTLISLLSFSIWIFKSKFELWSSLIVLSLLDIIVFKFLISSSFSCNNMTYSSDLNFNIFIISKNFIFITLNLFS